MTSRVERYRACAAIAWTHREGRGSVAAFNRASDEMRAIVADAYRDGPEAVAGLFPLLDEPQPARWLAITLADRGDVPPVVLERCLSMVRARAAGDDVDALMAEWWLKERDEKEHGKRASVVGDETEPSSATPSATDWAEQVEAISDHIERHLGPIHRVFHEIVSDDLHIDLHWVAPNPKWPLNTLVTTGMSERPMTTPPGAEAFAYAELILNLPADWPMSADSGSDPHFGWPIALLKRLARYPHEQATWLWMNHTVGEPGGEPHGPGTRQSAAIISPSVSTPFEFFTCEAGGRTIHFFSVMPLYDDELSYTARTGAEALYARFAEAGLRDIVAPDRRSVCGPAASRRR